MLTEVCWVNLLRSGPLKFCGCNLLIFCNMKKYFNQNCIQFALYFMLHKHYVVNNFQNIYNFRFDLKLRLNKSQNRHTKVATDSPQNIQVYLKTNGEKALELPPQHARILLRVLQAHRNIGLTIVIGNQCNCGCNY